MNNSLLSRGADLYKALGHPVRLRILAMLHDGSLCVCQITAVLRLAPSTVSAHLTDLRRAGLVDERKVGRWVHYSLSTERWVSRIVKAAQEHVVADSDVAEDRRLIAELRKIPVETLCRVDLDLAKLGIRKLRVSGKPRGR